MYQRQLSKEGLLGVIEDREQINTFSTVELKRLFMLDKFTTSDTHASLDCDCAAACSSNRQRDDDDSNKLGKKRTAACREYVVSESLKLVATKLPPQSSETKKKIVDHLEAVRSRLSENHFLTMPLLCREIERIFVELVKSTKDEGVAAIVEKIRGDMQKSWHELVHKLYLIDEEEESCEEETKDISEEKKTGHKPQVGMPTEEDLKSWSHHSSVATVDDDVLKAALSGKYRKSVSFVFGLETTASLIKQAEKEKEKEDIHDQIKENVPPNKEED